MSLGGRGGGDVDVGETGGGDVETVRETLPECKDNH